MQFQMMRREAITPSPLNPRKSFDPEKLQALAATMGNGVGIIEPLVVRVNGTPGTAELVAGERRWRAAAIAGLEEVPVLVKPLSDAQVLEIMVIENNQREDISPLEEADGYKRLLKLNNTGLANDDTKRLDVDTLAQRLGRSKKYVYDRIKLLSLSAEAQTLLSKGRITAGHGILLARLTPEQQKAAIDPKSARDGYDDGLFRYSNTPLDDADAGAAKGKKKAGDPYRGMELAPVRSFQAWIRENCRLNLAATDTKEEFPELAGAIEKAVAVVHITTHYSLPSGGDEASGTDGGPKIHNTGEWRRADGREGSKKCPAAVTGVVVLGRERGQAFPVCVDKACKVHWPPARKAQRGSSYSAPTAAERKKAKARQEAESARIQRANAEWQKAIPAVIAAIAAKLPAAKPSVLGDVVLAAQYLQARDFEQATALLKSTKEDAAITLQRLALAALLEKCGPGVYYLGQLSPLARRIGVDVAAIVKKAQTSAPAAAAEQKTAATRAKSVEVRKAIAKKVKSKVKKRVVGATVKKSAKKKAA